MIPPRVLLTAISAMATGLLAVAVFNRALFVLSESTRPFNDDKLWQFGLSFYALLGFSVACAAVTVYLVMRLVKRSR